MTRIGSRGPRQLLFPVQDSGPELSTEQQQELELALAELLLSVAAAGNAEPEGEPDEQQDY